MTYSERLAQQVKQTRQTLVNSLANLSPEMAARHPREDCWSVLDCVEHLYLVEKPIVRLLTKPNSQTVSGEDQVFGHERMHKALLNRERKITAPDAFVPKGQFATLEEAETAVNELRDKLASALENNQITFDGQTFPHPVLGMFTRLDWVNFVITHAQRHQAQIEEIKEIIGAPASITSAAD